MARYLHPPRTFEQVIQPFAPDIQSLCQAVRTHIQSALPKADEGVYGGTAVANVLYSIGGENNVLCGFQAAADHVKVFFHHWQTLKEKGVSIRGSGKHARHIKLTPNDDQLSKLPQYIAWVHSAAQ